jgi:hypothetical protein
MNFFLVSNISEERGCAVFDFDLKHDNVCWQTVFEQCDKELGFKKHRNILDQLFI